jgi:hypothetical protein
MSTRLLQNLGFGVVLAPVVAIVIWTAWIIHAFDLQKPMAHNLLRAALMAFRASNLRSITFGSLCFGAGISGLITMLAYNFGNPRLRQHGHVRGSEFVEQSELARYARRSVSALGERWRDLSTFADVAIPDRAAALLDWRDDPVGQERDDHRNAGRDWSGSFSMSWPAWSGSVPWKTA